MQTQVTVKVWDPLVRILHWTVVIAFTLAYLTGDELRSVHTLVGYLVGGAVLVRLVWGAIGTRHARFKDFVYSPSRVLAYLRELLMLRPPRYLGHNPAGGFMVVLLLGSLLATTGTGVVLYGTKGGGPLASLAVTAPPVMTARHGGAPVVQTFNGEHEAGVRGGHDSGEHHEGGLLRAVHDFFANLTLTLILAHIAGVVLDSLLHSENLARAMVTGRKRPIQDE